MGIEIHRTRHTREYVTIPNYISRDGTLSLTARGLLVYLLSLPTGWPGPTAADDLARIFPDSRQAIRRAMRELRDGGYIQLHTGRGPDGRTRRRLDVSDTKRALPAFGVTSTNGVSPQVAPNAGIPTARRAADKELSTEPKYGEVRDSSETLAIPSQAIEVSSEVGEQPPHVTRARAIAAQRWASPQDIAAQQAAESRARRLQREAQEDTEQRDEPRIMNSATLKRWSVMRGDGTAIVVGTAADMQAMATLLALDDELRKDTQMTPLATLKTWRRCSSRAAR